MTQPRRSPVEFWRLAERCLFVSGPERELTRLANHDAVLTAHHARFGTTHACLLHCENDAALNRLASQLTQSGYAPAPDHLAATIDLDTALALVAWLHRSVQLPDRQGADSRFAALIGRLAASHVQGSATIAFHRIGGRRLLAGMISGPVPIMQTDPVTISWSEGESPGSIRACQVWSTGRGDRIQTCVVVSSMRDLPQQANILVASRQGFVRLAATVVDHEDIDALSAAAGRAGSVMLATLAGADEDWRALTERHLERKTGEPGLTSPRFGLHVYFDCFVAMPHGVYLSGRIIDPDGVVVAMDLLDTTLETTDVLSAIQGQRTPIALGDTVEPGTRFRTFLPRKAAGPVRHAVELVIRLVGGGEALVLLRMEDRTLKGMRRAIVDSLVGAPPPVETFNAVIRPSLQPVHDRIAARIHVHANEKLGPSSRRTVSIIVPLYRETGFIIRQLLAFAADPVLREEAEIIFCVDDPAIENAVRVILTGWGKIWPLDLSLVVLSENAGYGLANNLAVSVANAPTIVLMNSDVVPDRPGWLQPMLDELAALPAFSVLGPKLLYADGTLQHAGMSFLRLPAGFWQNVHPGKGQGRDDRIAMTDRDVPAVTGALMVMARADFLAVGGFSPDYISGDYEDSDLCLKLRAQGGRCRYIASAELYHFERQSIGDADVDRGTTIHNRLLQHVRWDPTIRALAQHYPEIGDA